MSYNCNIYSILVISFFLFFIKSKAQISSKDISRAIDLKSLDHPYLYFNESEKKDLIYRIENDSESNDIFRELEAKAKVWLSMPVDYNIPIQGKNTRADWSELDRSSKYSQYYSTNRNNSFLLAFLYQMTGNQKYADKAFEFADAFCDLTTWTQRAHEFPIIYSRIMPWNVPDDQVNFNFDHFNGDSGRMMAAVYDWLYPALNRAQRDRIRGALLEKVITRVRGDYEFHWWATAYRCNWCGVCNSGVGLAGLALLKEHPQLTDVVAESFNRINSMFNELGIDGGWQEGGGYWNYGVHTSSFFADALKRLTKGKFNLFKNERLRQNPVTFPLHISLPDNRSLNFEDSRGTSLVGSPHLINKLATETKSPIAAWYRNEFFNAGNNIFDIIWPKPKSIGKPPANPSIHFRTLDWWVMRSDFKDPNKVVVAGKAGMNDDPHHGHLDIGHFIIYWKNNYFIRDLGMSGYDEKYFDEDRFNYPEANSEGHNTVFVNGEVQISGKYYKKAYDYSVGGKVIEFRSSTSRDFVLMNPTNAFPKKELKHWTRSVLLEKPNLTLLLDKIKANNKDAYYEIRFHPGVDYQIHKKYVLLGNGESKMALIPITDIDFNLTEGKHASQMVNPTQNFKWIKYFDIEFKSESDNVSVATLILPIANKNEIDEILESKSISSNHSRDLKISFIYKNKTYQYEYELTENGYSLK